MNGMYLGGRNIDGGTYPADIWGTYMKQAVGSYCGDFKRPTEPFHSQPFKGHYARQGGKDDNEKSGDDAGRSAQIPEPGTETEPENDDATATAATPTAAATTTRPTTAATADNGAAFDPNQYETPPQGAPETATPGGGTQAPPGDGLAGSHAPDWYNLRRQSRPAAASGESVREGSAAAAVLAHAGSRGVAV